MNITNEIDQLIAENGGSCRDALNVTMARLRHAQADIARLKEGAEILQDIVEAAITYLDSWTDKEDLRVATYGCRCELCELIRACEEVVTINKDAPPLVDFLLRPDKHHSVDADNMIVPTLRKDKDNF